MGSILKHLFGFAFLLGVAFILHKNILMSSHQTEAANTLLSSYLVNGLLCAIIFLVLLGFVKQKSTLLGWIFLLGSLLKIAVYFAYFFPQFKEDGIISKAEFFTFFIPYFIALVAEVWIVVRSLNAKNKSHSKEKK